MGHFNGKKIVSGYYNSKKLISGYFNGDKIYGEKILDILTLTSQEDGSTIGYTIKGSLPDINIQISTNGSTWINWDGSPITLNNGEYRYIRNTADSLSTDAGNYFQFEMTGKIAASGDISSMINYSSLSDYCFYAMFFECSSLITAPELPATTLTKYCYYSMFGSTSLTKAPEIPATIVNERSCAYMFYFCNSLVESPTVLLATTLAPYCYSNMFESCISLVTAPEIYVETAADYCCYNMFIGCSSLKVRENGSGVRIFNCPSTSGLRSPFYEMFRSTAGFFRGTPTTGNIYYRETPLKLTATEDNSSISYHTINPELVHIQTSLDEKNWEDWSPDTDITLNNGEYRYIRNTTNYLSSYSANFKFVMVTGKIKADGDISSMLNYGPLYDACYNNLFFNCTSLITPPDLPETTLKKWCYSSMFRRCISLIKAPELPATTLEEACYHSMFLYCYALKVNENGTGTKIFNCPTTIPDKAVHEMFNDTAGTFAGTPSGGNIYNWY